MTMPGAGIGQIEQEVYNFTSRYEVDTSQARVALAQGEIAATAFSQALAGRTAISGIDKFENRTRKGAQAVTTITHSIAGAINRAGELVGALGQVHPAFEFVFGNATKLASTVVLGIGDIVTAAQKAEGRLVAMAGAVGGMLSRIGRQLLGEAVAMAKYAGQIETLWTTVRIVGKNAGKTFEQTKEMVDAFVKSGITTEQSLRNILALLGQGLDMGVEGTKKFARAAQNLAVAFGQDSSAAMFRFQQFIMRGNVRMVQGLGIMKSASTMQKEYAKSIGKAVSELTQQEIYQARINGLIDASSKFAGAYEKAMNTMAKQLGSMNRYLIEFRKELGDYLLPYLTKIVFWLKGVLQGFRKLPEGTKKAIALFIGLGGALAVVLGAFLALAPGIAALVGLLPAIGAALAPLVVPILAVVAALVALKLAWDKNLGGIQDKVRGWVSYIRDNFEDLVVKAFEWGFNLIAEYAEGIAQAASSVVQSALGVVGDMISQFLAAFSPPKKGALQEIGVWGKGLMSEYLRSMTEADYGLLDEAGRRIKDVVSHWAEMGYIGETAVVPTIAGITEEVAGLISTFRRTGEVGDEAFAKIEQRLGGAAPEFMKWLKLKTKELALAEKFKKAQEKYKKEEERINKLQRLGVSSNLLAIRRERAGAELEALSEEAKQLQEQISLQEQYMSMVQQGQDLQRQQIQILQRIAQEMERLAKKTRAGTKLTYEQELAMLEKKKADGLLTEEEFIKAKIQLNEKYYNQALRKGDPTDKYLANIRVLKAELEKLGEEEAPPIGKAIDDAVTDAEDKIAGVFSGLQEKLGQMWDDFKTRLAEQVKAPFEAIGQAWEDFKTRLFGGALATGGIPIVGVLQDFYTEHAPRVVAAFQSVKDIVDGVVGPIKERIGELWTLIQERWAEIAPEIEGAWTAVFGRIMSVVTGVITWASTAFTNIMTFIETNKEAITTALGGLWTTLSGIIEAAIFVITGILQTFLLLIQGDWSGAWEAIKTTATGVWEALKKAAGGLVTFFENWLPLVVAVFASLAQAIVDWATGVTKTVEDWAAGIAKKVGDWATDFVTKIETWAANFVTTLMTGIAELPKKLFGEDGFFPRIWKALFGPEGWAASVITRIFTAGQDIINGFLGGLKDKWGAIKDWFEEKINGLPEAVKKALGLGSPSKVFQALGQDTVAGFTLGLQDAFPATMATLKKFFADLAEAAEGFNEDLVDKLIDLATILSVLPQALVGATRAFQQLTGYAGAGVPQAVYDDIIPLFTGIKRILDAISTALPPERDLLDYFADIQVFSETAGKVIEAIAKALSVLSALSSYEQLAEWGLTMGKEGPEYQWVIFALNGFERDLGLLLDKMKLMAKKFDIDTMIEVQAFAETAGKLMEMIGKALGALFGIGQYETFTTLQMTWRDGSMILEWVTIGLNSFEHDFTLLLDKMSTIADNWLAKYGTYSGQIQAFAETAGKLMEMVGSALEILPSLRDYVGLARWGLVGGEAGPEYDWVIDALDSLSRDLAVIMDKFAQAAIDWNRIYATAAVPIQRFVSSALLVVQLIGEAIGVLTLLGKYKPIGRLVGAEWVVEALSSFEKDLREVLETVRLVAKDWQAHAKNLSKFAELLSVIFDAVRVITDALASVAETRTIPAAIVSTLKDNIVRVLTNVRDLSNEFGKTEAQKALLAQAQAFAERLSPIGEALGKIIEPMNALVGLRWVPERVLDTLRKNYNNVINWLREQVTLFKDQEGEGWAQEGEDIQTYVTTVLTPVFEALGGILDAIADVTGGDVKVPGEARLAKLQEAISAIFTLFAGLPQKLREAGGGADPKAAMATSLEVINSIAEVVSLGLGTIARLMEVTAPTGESITAFVNALVSMYGTFSTYLGLMETDVTQFLSGLDWYAQGEGLVQSLIDGMTDMIPALVAALSNVASYLPHSLAERGPLSQPVNWSMLSMGLSSALSDLRAGLSIGALAAELSPAPAQGGSTTNVQYNVEANYRDRESPGGIRATLAAVSMAERMRTRKGW